MPVILRSVPKNSDKDKRGRTIPIWDDRYAWWSEAVTRERLARGWSQAEIVRRLKGQGHEVQESAITRCIKREIVAVDLAIRISDLLGVAYPVFLPESEAEAREMMERRAVAQRRASLERGEEELRRKLAELDQRLGSQRPARRRRRAG